MDVLLEWLTTEGNCAEYCGANGNKGKTKTQAKKQKTQGEKKAGVMAFITVPRMIGAAAILVLLLSGPTIFNAIFPGETEPQELADKG